jgi:hypothetical protein
MKYWGRGILKMYAKGVSISFEALNYANLSEHGSLDEMNKLSILIV